MIISVTLLELEIMIISVTLLELEIGVKVVSSLYCKTVE